MSTVQRCSQCRKLECAHRVGEYAGWAAERLVVDESAVLLPDAARVDYTGWCSGSFLRRQPRSKQRAAVRDAGAVVKGRGSELRYLGVRLVGALPDSGYRVASYVNSQESGDVEAACLALWSAGLVTDSTALDVAVVALGQVRPLLCRVCGRVTRRSQGLHVRCAR